MTYYLMTYRRLITRYSNVKLAIGGRRYVRWEMKRTTVRIA